MTLTRIISRSPTHSIAHPRNQHRQERIEREKTMTTTTDTDAADAPDLEIIDAATATGMVNDRLAAILPTLQDAAFDIYLSGGLRGRPTSYAHVSRLGWVGYLEASDLPGRSHGYYVAFPLKPSTTYGTGVGVWTDHADSNG